MSLTQRRKGAETEGATVALSISRGVKERLYRGPFVGQVLAVFDQACNLVTHDGEVVALVTPHIGDGPLNVVVDGSAGPFFQIDPAAAVALQDDRLVTGGLRIDLAGAAVWEPRPDWETLRDRRAVLASGLTLVRSLCLRHALHIPSVGLLALLGVPVRDDAFNATLLATARQAAQELRQGWRSAEDRGRAGAAWLAGLGGGLTPAGDDFLVGAMLWAWLVHPDPAPFCRALAEAAAHRTTTLSAAFLRASARGECGAAWHRLLAALGEGDESAITKALPAVLAHGATSGADALAGFLYLGTDGLRGFLGT